MSREREKKIIIIKNEKNKMKILFLLHRHTCRTIGLLPFSGRMWIHFFCCAVKIMFIYINMEFVRLLYLISTFRNLLLEFAKLLNKCTVFLYLWVYVMYVCTFHPSCFVCMLLWFQWCACFWVKIWYLHDVLVKIIQSLSLNKLRYILQINPYE